MRLEPRYKKDGNGNVVPDRVIIVSEDLSESRILDEFFGSKVADDGLISNVTGQLRLADGYGEHYLQLKQAK